MDSLAVLEAEVKADADAQRARKEAALAKLRDQRVTQTAERDQLRARQAELVGKKRTAVEEPARAGRTQRDAELDDLGGALELASKANRVKNELARPREKGEKSWLISGAASLTGPFGWLYAGSFREAIPASAAWLALLAFMLKFLPIFVSPLLMITAPVSAIAGVVYALQYNRAGRRKRLFGGNKDKSKRKQLGSG